MDKFNYAHTNDAMRRKDFYIPYLFRKQFGEFSVVQLTVTCIDTCIHTYIMYVF